MATTLDRLKELSDSRNEAIEKLTDEMYRLIGDGQDELYKQIIRKYLLKELKLTEDGKIRNIPGNYASTGTLDKVFKQVISDEMGSRLVKEIKTGTEQINRINSFYFDLFDEKKITEISDKAHQRVLDTYGITGSGVTRESALNPILKGQEALARIKSLIHQAIASEANITDLESALKRSLVDEGLIKRYLDSTSVSNVYDRYDRATTEEYSQAIGLNYAIYQGGIIRDSRDFCRVRNAKVFTREEIKKFGTPDDKFEGYTDKSKGEFQGKFKPSTKIYDPITDLGGYNCRHHLDWISDDLATKLRPELSTNKKARDLAKNAKASAGELGKLSDDIASKHGGTSTPVNFKTVDSIERKTLSELNGDITKLQDSIRTTIIAEKNKLGDIVSDLENTPGVYRVKRQEFNSGYTGYLVNYLTTDKIQAEIQVNTPKMIFAKETPDIARRLIGDDLWQKIAAETGQPGGLGHKYYEEIRALNIGFEDQDIQKRLADILEKSREYYSHFQ